jgi:hypothetical protein
VREPIIEFLCGGTPVTDPSAVTKETLGSLTRTHRNSILDFIVTDRPVGDHIFLIIHPWWCSSLKLDLRNALWKLEELS